MAGKNTRAGFLGTGAAALGGAALAGAWHTDRAAAIAAIKGESEPVEGVIDVRLDGDAFFFELGGVPCGLVPAVRGGSVSADVVTEKLGGDHIQRKHVANIKYNDISLSVGTGMSKGFYDWIKSSFDKKPVSQSGAIVGLDTKSNATGSGPFRNAFITEIGFPALDASSKDPAYLTVKLAPESTGFAPRSGPAKPGGSTPGALGKGAWKMSIDGLPTSRVTQVDAFTVKLDFEDVPGSDGTITKQPAKIEIPNLKCSFSAQDAQPWVDYFESFAIQGNSGDANEKTGSLTYLAQDMKTSLFTLNFSGLGIFKVAPDKLEAGGEGIRRVTAELYCEDIRFDYGGGAATG